MNAFTLAVWLHDNYEKLAKDNNWQTQEKTKVEFDNLPMENKNTMLALADKMLNTFSIIAVQANVSGSNRLHLPPIKKKAIAELVCPDCKRPKLENHLDYIHCKNCDTYFERAN